MKKKVVWGEYYSMLAEAEIIRKATGIRKRQEAGELTKEEADRQIQVLREE